MDTRQSSPAAERNKDPLLAVLRPMLPETGLVLEIAAGTGQHAAHFAAALPHLTWQPTDKDAALFPSIQGWTVDLPNVRPPLLLDVHNAVWPVQQADAVLAINMIHIAPWSASEALFAGAARLLSDDESPLVLYGPFKRDGAHTAPSNADFDTSLRQRDPSWGVRDLADVQALAAQHGFRFDAATAMPANNLTVVFRRAASAA